jgi:EPS-associated MarR family transcriptional regulator
MPHSITDEVRYRILRYVEEHPQVSQRELAEHLGVSLGKVNYCLRALIRTGFVKMRNFRGSRRKLAYAYYLTPQGIDEKIKVTYRFLRIKTAEYDAISSEIERLTNELADSGLLDSEKARTG